MLFADLVGSTGLTEKLDPEESREVVKKFYDVVQHVVERWFQGTVANFLGDAVLAVFGLPVSHEDDPERAVRAGLAIREAMPVLNAHLASTHGVQLAVRVGINTGEVVAASGSTFDRDFLVSDAVTTAARLQQTVAPGTVVVGERTYRLTRESIEYHDLPPLEVKGKDTPLHVWAASRALPESADLRRITAPLVGRHGELGLLRHLYQRSRDEARIHLVTVFGQPGVGKSRVLREFLAEVRESSPPPLVLRGRGVAFGGHIGYHALIDILHFQAGLLDTDPPEVVRTKIASWLADALPGRDDLLEGLLLTFGTEDGAGTDPVRTRERLFESWRTLVYDLAAQQPVILAFEDLHWADDGVLDLIQEVTAGAEAVPLFVICLTRPELLERRPHWSGGRRNTSVIDLEPLKPEETELLVASLASQGLPPETARVIVQRAEGNPLFVEELVRMLLEGSTPGAAIPDTVQAVLTARIDRLPPEERRALQAAAVIGRTFWPSAVARIAGLSEDDTTRAIGVLIGKELVVNRPRSTVAQEKEFAFRHILTRDVAYNLLPKSARQRAHVEAARWMEARFGERLEEVVEILAEHLRLTGDHTRAAEYLHRAGNKARRLYANTDAIRLYDQALEAAAGAGLPFQRVAEICRDRGEVHELLGRYAEALEDFEKGLAAVREAGDTAVQAILENRIGLIHHRQLRLEDAEAHFTRAVTLARRSGERRTLGRSLVDLANIAWDRGTMLPDHPAIVEGLQLLRDVNDLPGVARGLNLLGMSQLGAGNGNEAIQAVQEALAAGRRAGDKSREATSLSYLCVMHGFLGRFREALPYGQAAIALAEEIGDLRRMSFTHFFIARIQVSLGDWDQTILHSEAALNRGWAPIQLPWLLFLQGMAYYSLGDYAHARAVWAKAGNIETRSAGWRQVALLSAIGLARLDRDPGSLNQALDEILKLPWGVFIPSDGEALLPVGEALLEVERIEELRRFLTERRPVIEKLASPPYLAALAILDAQMAAREGRTAEAAAPLHRALRWTDESGDALRGWRVRELLLTLLKRPEDRAALRIFLTRIAESLPEHLRGTFLASPRATVLRG